VATIGVLSDGKRTFTTPVGSTDFIGSQTVWNKAVAQSYNVVNGTAATYDDDGDLLSATVAAPITFTGNNIHSGTITQNGAVTHNADFTVQPNHIISLNSPIFMYNGDYNFSSSSGSHVTQKLRNKGQANKILMITATDAGNSEQNILSLANAGSEFYRPITVPTPTDAGHAATKSYVDTHASAISGGQSTDTFTLTFDGTGTVPSTKVTTTAHYMKTGKLVYVHFTAKNLDFTGYAGGSIRMTGLPHAPDTTVGEQIGTIHSVNFKVNNNHADDGHIVVVGKDSTYGNFLHVFSEQVTSETTYIPNTTGAIVRVSITYIAE